MSSKQSVDSAQSTASPLNANSRMSKQDQYRQEYRDMHRRIREYYQEIERREQKKKDNIDTDSTNGVGIGAYGPEHVLFEKDRATLDRLYGYLQRDWKVMGQRTPLTRYPLSAKHSKDVLNLLLKFKVRTRHCGFHYDQPREIVHK